MRMSRYIIQPEIRTSHRQMGETQIFPLQKLWVVKVPH